MASVSGLEAQRYPLWFLEQGRLPCPAAVGYARAAYHGDSAAGQALVDAQCTASRQRRTAVRGGQAFWRTATGAVYLGHDYVEVFDTTACDTPVTVVGLDTFATGGLVMVLAGRGPCALPEALRGVVACGGQGRPQWLESLPEQAGTVLAVGAAPVYFYEASCWREAEARARMELARRRGMQVVSRERSRGGLRDALTYDSLSVVLRDVQVAARWRDGDRACYVLVRMPEPTRQGR